MYGPHSMCAIVRGLYEIVNKNKQKKSNKIEAELCN